MKKSIWILTAIVGGFLVGCSKTENTSPQSSQNTNKPALNIKSNEDEPTTLQPQQDDGQLAGSNPATTFSPQETPQPNNPTNGGAFQSDGVGAAPIENTPDTTNTASDSSDASQTVEPEPRPAPVIPADWTPEEVVTEFLKSLCSGDEAVITALLTDRAREETAKQGLAIQPIGTEKAKYEVAKAQYPEGQQDGAWVNTIWNEIDPEGNQIQFEAIWALRRQPNGWRVVGMMTRINPESPSRFFNFEEPQELFQELKKGEQEALEKQAQEQQAQQQGTDQPGAASKDGNTGSINQSTGQPTPATQPN